MTKFTMLMLAGLLAGSGIAQAGVIVGGTRVIFDGSKNESTLSVDNPDPAPYLIQTWVENEAGQRDKNSFVVTPPLFRLDAKQKNTLRILKGTQPIAQDRETLFWLNIKSIPSGGAAMDTNSLQLAINARMKLIFRPASLKGSSPEEANKQLKWLRAGQSLVVSNPTPYYINFYSLSIGGKEVDRPTFVAPHGSATFAWPEKAVGSQVEWKVISDYGAMGAPHKITP